MKSRIVTLLLSVGIVFSGAAVIPTILSYSLPGNQQGYEPEQPIAFSHRLHAGELQIACLYCHGGAERSKHAGIPSANICMNCHKSVTAPLGSIRAEEELAKQEGRKPGLVVSPKLRKLFDYLGLDANLKPDETKPAQPIPWLRVHNLPDFACFDHRAHVHVGVTCQKCHGSVESMERVRQVERLSMGWCVQCHREAQTLGVAGKKVNPSLDCAACHY